MSQAPTSRARINLARDLAGAPPLSSAEPRFVPYAHYREYAPAEMRERVDAFERGPVRRQTAGVPK